MEGIKEMITKKILSFEVEEKLVKQIKEIAKNSERNQSFCIRKAIEFWLAHGAPEKFETKKGGKKL